jgi:3-hydroxybutyryl-CoA dehydrogenase
MSVMKIAVIGAGTMGGGIAEVAARSGFEVILEDTEQAFLRAGLKKIEERLSKRLAEGRLSPAEKDALLSRIRTTTTLEDCAEADLIIEAAVEKEETKNTIFRELGRLCPAGTIFTSNTSAISITRLGQASGRPDRFLGMHFMNPAPVMKLVEIVTGLRTTGETLAVATSVCEKMGKTAVIVKDSPAFVSSRLVMLLVNEAIYCLEEGIASRDGIDAIMTLGAHHPMGPLALADLMGLDICLATLDLLHAEMGEKYRPCVMLRQMVAAGKLGKKSGEGFYDYR